MSFVSPLEKCPCGSGKRFINCCFKLHHEYCKVYLPKWTTAKNKCYVYDKTLHEEYLAKILGFLDFHTNKDYELCMNDYPNLLFYIDKLSGLYLMHTDCHKGCDYCCYMAVATSEFEAEYIKRYIERNWSSEQKSKLHSKIKKLKREHREIFDFSYIESNLNISNPIPCLFLEDECCSIYACRPAICRTYMSFSPSEICREVQLNSNKDIQILEADSAEDFRNELFSFYLSHAKVVYGHQHLAYWFSNF